jgi:hypothetical protein
MLRGLATVKHWADDLEVVKEWYAEVAYTDPQNVSRASKEPKAMRFAVQPNG